MKSYFQRQTDFPVLAAARYKNLVFIAGGGGGQKFGIPNQIESICGISFLKKDSFPLGDILIEGLYANEVKDYLIGYSETKVLFFLIDENGKLSLKQELEFKSKNYDFIKVYAFDDTLCVYNNEQEMILYKINTGNKLLREFFKVQVKEKILNFFGIKESNFVFVIFADRIMIFSLINKKFVGECLKDYKLLKFTHLQDLRDEELLLVLTTNQNMTKLLFLESHETNKYQLVKEQCLFKIQSSTFKVYNNLLSVASVDGFIYLYVIKDLDVKLIYKKKYHELPIKSIMMRKMPTTFTGELQTNLVSIGVDYKINSVLFSEEQIIKNIQKQTFRNVMIVLVLVLAILLGLFLHRDDVANYDK